MEIKLAKAPWHELECDILMLPVFQDEDPEGPFFQSLNEKLSGLLRELVETSEWKGKQGELTVIHRPAGLRVGRLVLLGAGPRESYDGRAIRECVRRALNRVKGFNLRRIAIYRRSRLEISLAAQAAVEGAVMAFYDPDEFKTTEKSKSFAEEILFVTDQNEPLQGVEEAMQKGRILGEATNLARSLVNQPGNQFAPPALAEKARELAERYGLEVEIWGEPEMQRAGMNAVLAVARGSDEPARFIILRHLGGSSDGSSPVVLAGKGVTFDSGGISLKPAQSMEEMKADKAGACAVLAAMQAIAQLQVRKNVVGLIPAVENLPSGRAQRPGDVIRSMSGKTIEVINTDAEGRLILADALHYARTLQPQYIVDIATLTGACIVALGHYRAGVFCNQDSLFQKLERAASISGELFWRLPLDDFYRRELDSTIADIKNVGSRWGGAIIAAKFLQEFVGDVPWCHIDMAGVDLFKGEEAEKGPTGFGVRTLTEMVLL